MRFADITFPNKESLATQAFAFSRFKKQTPKSSWRLPFNMDMDYRRNTKWGPDLISQLLPCTETFQTWWKLQVKQKKSYRWPYHDCLVTWKPLATCLQKLYSKETIFLFYTKCNLLRFIHKTVAVSYSQ